MDKSSVMVELSIYGDRFDPEYITKQLGITPSRTHLKGELFKNGNMIRKNTLWEISTGYDVSIDINDQLDKIISMLRDKTDIIIKLKNEFYLNVLIMIVIYIENKEIPAMYFKKPFLHFVNAVDGEIGFDVYD